MDGDARQRTADAGPPRWSPSVTVPPGADDGAGTGDGVGSTGSGEQVEPAGSAHVLLGVGVGSGVGGGSWPGSGDSVGAGVGGVGATVGRVGAGFDGVGRSGGTSGRSDTEGDPLPTGTADGTRPAERLGTGTTVGDAGPGGPTTTGPREGVGRNGVPAFGGVVPPTVAEPALIAATIGIEAVPASRATVNR
ncbi:hypothetical protein [Micromonospora sp. NPDC023956]|uniref:hypothetical protein n=1 Tax=Micromonospora sp. NPDC023956 TaxID=3155722 RepID=UPI00340E59AE